MNKTTNYQLNQWVKSDRVLMEDFNADNAKIDAAIKAVDTKVNTKADKSALTSLQSTVSAVSARAGSDIILDHTFTEAAALFTADLSGVDWSKYSVIFSYVAPTSGGRFYTPFGGDTMTSDIVEVLFPMRSAGTKLCGFCVVNSTGFHSINLNKTFREFTTYQLKNPYDVFGVGTVARVIGIH